MISYHGLVQLGFSPEEFELQDDGLGEGVFFKKWNSDQPQPSLAEIEAAEQVYIAETAAAEEAKATAEAETESKLEALGLTKEDLAALLGS